MYCSDPQNEDSPEREWSVVHKGAEIRANNPGNYGSEFKVKVVLERIGGKRSVSKASRAHKVAAIA